MTTPIPPTGFIFHKKLFKRLDTPFWKIFVIANFLALLPLLIGLLLLWTPYQLYLAAGAPWALFSSLTMPLWVSILLGLLIFLASMFLHEWLHGIAMSLMGRKPVYYFRSYVLYAGLQKGDYLTRRQYLTVTLMPLLSMSIGGFIFLLWLPPALGRLLLIALLLNTAASLGDLFVAYNVFKSPKKAIFNDDNGIQVYLPE